MTINLSDNNPRVSYNVAQGVTQSSFTVSFEFFDDDDLNVYVDGTLKTLTTDYTVSGGDGSTGTVTISVTGATGGSTVVITRDIDLDRTTDFPSSGPFNIGSLNTELDRFVAIAADLNDRAARSLQLSDYDTSVTVVLPDVDDRKGTVLAFNSTTGAVEAGPTTSNVNTLADITDDIATLADIEDGTDATDAIQTVAGISSNVTTVAGVSANVTTVAGISSNVTTVAGISANTTTVAGISSDVTTVAGISSDVTTVAGDAADIATVASDSADIQSLAAVSTQIGLLGTADAIADMNTLATSAIVTDLDALADLATEIDALGDVTSDITTVSGISANVTTVAGVSANVTTVAGISSNVTTVAGVSSDVTTVAGISANVTTVAGDTTNIGTLAGISSDITTVSGISSNVTTVATNNANITTVASNITGVNSFAERYRVSSSDPTTSLDEGDLAYNSTSNVLKYYNGSSWQSISPGIGSVADDSSPQLGGNLDLNSNNITGTGNISVTGDLTIDTNTLYVDSTNNRVGIGTSSPSQQLHLSGSTPIIRLTDTDTNAYGEISSSSSDGNLMFYADQGNTQANTTIRFYVDTTERMRIDSSGNLLVGTTVTPVNLLTATSGGGMGFDPTDNYLVVAREGTNSSKPVIRLNQTGVDGSIAEFRKDGTTVGSIGVGFSDNLYIANNTSGHGGIMFGTNDVIPMNGGSLADATTSLGESAWRWKDLYLSGSAYVGDKIIHDGDTDTYIGFTSNNINFRAANVEMTYNDYGLFLKDGSVREDYDALSGTSPTCNVNNGGAFSLSMSGNTTFSFTSPASGYSTGFVLELTGNGSTVTWPASVDWAGGTAPDAPASGETDLLVFWTRNGGTTWYGMLAMDAAA